MAIDSVRALKLEAPASGGTQTDTNPTEINALQDALSAAGLYVQSPAASATDKTVLVDRTSGSLRFTDQVTTHVLGELVSSTSGQTGSHDSLRDLAHFMGDQGPSYGLGNSYCANNYSGPLLTGTIWYTSAAMTTKIVSKTLAYAAGSPVPSTITWTLYNSSGGVVRTCVDTLTYAGPIAYACTRAWS